MSEPRCCECRNGNENKDCLILSLCAESSEHPFMYFHPAADSKDAKSERLRRAEEALRIIARNTKAGAVDIQWVKAFANEAIEELDR